MGAQPLALLLGLLSLSACASAPAAPTGELALPAGATPRGQVLVVMSAADRIELAGGASHPTGYFLSELIHPLEAILAAGYEVTFASPAGAPATLDQDSLHPLYWSGTEERARALRRVRQSAKLRAPLPLAEVEPRRYDGLFLPGGHAPMVDLARDPSMARLLRDFHAAGKPTAVLCHAPAALLSALPERDGSREPWPYQDYRMALFTSFEEGFSESLFLGGEVPYYIDEELAKAGAEVSSCVNPFDLGHALRDRELITGQNPYSAHELAELFVNALEEYRARGSLLVAKESTCPNPRPR